jgi:hypothetical protein
VKNRTIIFAAVLLVATLMGPLVWAEEPAADTTQIFLEKIRADKKLIVAQTLELTEKEAKDFWPVYSQYQQELEKLAEGLSKFTQEYVEAYGNITDEKAKQLLDNSLVLETDRLNLRKSYLPKFRQVLPEVKVARYYQLENKIYVAISYELACSIPLAR